MLYTFELLVNKAPFVTPLMQVYTNKDHLLDEAHGGASDGEDGRGPKMVFFDLKVAHRNMLDASHSSATHALRSNGCVNLLPVGFARRDRTSFSIKL